VNIVVNLRVPGKAGNCLTSMATISFSRRTAPWNKLIYMALEIVCVCVCVCVRAAHAQALL
jgi:hypothetical protein